VVLIANRCELVDPGMEFLGGEIFRVVRTGWEGGGGGGGGYFLVCEGGGGGGGGGPSSLLYSANLSLG